MKEVGWDWVPPHASDAARAEWQKPWYVRVKEILFPNAETFRNLMLAMIESFTAEELENAVATRADLVESFVVVAKLRHHFTKGPARLALQQNHWHAYRWLVGWPQTPNSGPPGILLELRSRDSAKAELIASPSGWTWFTGECYELARFFRDFGRLDKSPYNWPEIPPPPGHKPRALPSLVPLPEPTAPTA